jgi:hypothetical protein
MGKEFFNGWDLWQKMTFVGYLAQRALTVH